MSTRSKLEGRLLRRMNTRHHYLKHQRPAHISRQQKASSCYCMRNITTTLAAGLIWKRRLAGGWARNEVGVPFWQVPVQATMQEWVHAGPRVAQLAPSPPRPRRRLLHATTTTSSTSCLLLPP